MAMASPREDIIHRSVELEFPSIGFDPVEFSCSDTFVQPPKEPAPPTVGGHDPRLSPSGQGVPPKGFKATPASLFN